MNSVRSSSAARRRRPVTGAVRTGGRSARVVEHVLRTTLEELGRVGYAALRIEEVASRSGVNKTTVYRRWPTKPELVAAAIRAHKPPMALEDTGDLERDLVESFWSRIQLFDDPLLRGVVRMALSDREDPEVAGILRQVRAEQIAQRHARFHAAVKRGELPAGTPIALVDEALTGAIYNRFHYTNERISRSYVVSVVRLVLAGARAQANTRG